MRTRLSALLAVLVLVMFQATVDAAERDELKWIRSKPIIRSILIQGNHYFKVSEIKGRLYSRERSFWLALKGERRTRVQRETKTRDSLEIKYLYLKEGFLGMTMTEEIAPVGEDSTAEVRITIDEGRQFRIGERKTTGDYEPQFGAGFAKLQGRLKRGMPIDPIVIHQVIFDMKTHLANDGYPYAEITYALDTLGDPSRSEIAFSVQSGSKVHFGDVNVQGLQFYPEYCVRRELKITPGRLYRRQDILDTQQRLYESGYFSTLQLGLDEHVSDSLAPGFLLRVRERKPHYLTVKTGASQSTVRDLLWGSSIGFGKRNLIGSRTAEFTALYSFAIGHDSRLLSHEYRFRFTEPWFLAIRMPLLFTIGYRPRVHSATQAYMIESWSVSAATSRQFGRDYFGALGLEYQSVRISGVPADQQVVTIEEKGVSNRRRFYFQFRRDSRENIFIPDRGSFLDVTAQYFGGILGGDASFTKYEASYATYQIVWPGWISATHVKGGLVHAFGTSTFVPREDRFYQGGANSVRGFLENSLGPKEGSNVTMIFNQEFRWRTLQVHQMIPGLRNLAKTLPLWQSLFFDMGNGFGSAHEMRWNALALSVGMGIQLVSPAGPIRIDYARVIPTRHFSVDDRWHFTILYAF